MLRERFASVGDHARLDVPAAGPGEIPEHGRQVVDVCVAVAEEEHANARGARKGAARRLGQARQAESPEDQQDPEADEDEARSDAVHQADESHPRPSAAPSTITRKCRTQASSRRRRRATSAPAPLTRVLDSPVMTS
jgi:hypothetical protein